MLRENEANRSIGAGSTFNFFGEWRVHDDMDRVPRPLENYLQRAQFNILDGEAEDEADFNAAMRQSTRRAARNSSSREGNSNGNANNNNGSNNGESVYFSVGGSNGNASSSRGNPVNLFAERGTG